MKIIKKEYGTKAYGIDQMALAKQVLNFI